MADVLADSPQARSSMRLYRITEISDYGGCDRNGYDTDVSVSDRYERCAGKQRLLNTEGVLELIKAHLEPKQLGEN